MIVRETGTPGSLREEIEVYGGNNEPLAVIITGIFGLWTGEELPGKVGELLSGGVEVRGHVDLIVGAGILHPLEE